MADFETRPTLVMGARGGVGRHVLDELSARGLPVRASARDPRPGWFAAGIEVAAADLTDPSSLTRAFDGVGQVFLYAVHDGVQGVVTAARAAGVDRIVLMSSGSILNPTARGNSITEEHRDVEEAFAAATDLAVVPIRPLVLATNSLGWSSPITAGRALPLYRPDAMTAPVHERDIAAVAVLALTGNRSPEASGMLTGPARLTQRDQVAAIAAGTGRSIEIGELSRAAALAQFGRFMPPAEAQAVIELLDDADAGNSPATSTIHDLLGRPALDFGRWVADHATDFASPTG